MSLVKGNRQSLRRFSVLSSDKLKDMKIFQIFMTSGQFLKPSGKMQHFNENSKVRASLNVMQQTGRVRWSSDGKTECDGYQA